MIDALARSLIRHRAWWTSGALLVLAAALVLMSQLALRSEIEDFLPRGGHAVDTLAAVLDGGAGRVDRIIVVFESDAPMRVEEAAPVLDALATRLAAVPGVGRVEHRLRPELRRFLEREGPAHLLLFFTPRQLEALGARLSRDDIERILLRQGTPATLHESLWRAGIQKADPLGVVTPALGVLQRIAGGARVRLADGYLAVPSLSAFFMTVEPARRLTAIDSARVLVGAIEQVLQHVRDDPAHQRVLSGKRLFAVGRPVGYVRGHEVARADARRIALASTISLFALLLVFFRRPLGPLIILGTILFGVAITGAVAFLALGSVSLLGWMFISVLIGLGVDFGLYIVTHYWILADPAADRAGALAAALQRPGRGILFGGLTNASAFLSLVVVSYPVMVELGWLTALGMMVILAASFTVLPLALSYTRPGRAPGWARWTQVVHTRGLRHPWAWLAAWGTLVAGSLWAARSLPYEPHPWKVVLEANPATAELERVRRLLGASFTPLLMASVGATPEQALEHDREAVAALERVRFRAGVAAIESLSRWLPAPAQQRASIAYLAAHSDVFSAERFRRDFVAVASRMEPPDPALVRDYVPLVARFLNPRPSELTLDDLRRAGLDELVQRHVTGREGEYWAVSLVYLRKLPWADGAIGRFTETIERFGGPGLARARFTGDALRGVSHARVLRRDIALACGVATLLVGAILWLHLRRVRLVLLCLVPLACCVSGALGFMAVLGIELNVLTLAIAPLLVGLGVDNGIHVVERLRRGEPASLAIEETGPPMTMTTLSNIAGFACLGLSSFPGVRHVGLIGAVGLLVSLAAALHLVPLLYSLFGAREAGSGKREA